MVKLNATDIVMSKKETQEKNETANIQDLRVIFQSQKAELSVHQMIESVLQHFENKKQ